MPSDRVAIDTLTAYRLQLLAKHFDLTIRAVVEKLVEDAHHSVIDGLHGNDLRRYENGE